MSYLDTRSNAAIVGDAFQTKGRIAVAGQLREGFPYPAIGTWSKELDLSSAQKIRSFNPTLLAVGHGEMLSIQIENAINEALINLEERK